MPLRLILVLSLFSISAFANNPGGGPASGGTDVTLTDNGSTVTLSNGTITAVITKDNAKINSILFNGVQCVRQGGDIYYSMDGGSNYRQPSGCAYSVTTNTADMIDIGMRQTWSTQAQPLDIEIHYVLRRGDTGIYTYAILDHPAGYPAGGYGEWRMVWKLPNDTFENLFVDELRNRQMPTAADYAGASSTSIAEIVHLNSGILAGQDEGKYCYSTRYYDTPTWGHASNASDTGVWLVLGAHDYFNDGPFKQDLAPADRILHVHFGMNHYNGSSPSIAAGESWRKLYGPYLLYCNTDPAGAEACWEDAKAQIDAERSAWPYAWLSGNPDYPLAAGRATVSGTIDLNDPLKPSLNAEGAWVGLAAPDPGGNFQFESKRYQYWIKAGPGGSFTIPHVRPGTYTLYCVAEGVAGEFEYTTPVNVTAGQTLNLGTLSWNVPRTGSWLAWEIGLPDRDSREFFHGEDFWIPFRYQNFDNEFPNPLNYDVSSSVASTDWNYAQPGYLPDAGSISGWPWQVRFNLPALPASGTARLHLAFAGSHYARMNVNVNGSNPIGSPGFFYIDHSRGNALLRQSSHAKYAYHVVDVPVSLLSIGNNTISITQAKVDDISMHAMYDYVALEMPTLPGGNPADGDGDGLIDSWEYQNFRTLSLSSTEDPDGDGFINADEELGNSDPNDASSLPTSDADGDLIDDFWELAYYGFLTDAGPLDDTDGDGFNTWTEWKAGTDPRSGSSAPGSSNASATLAPVADTAVWFRSGQDAYSAGNHGSDPEIDNYAYPSVPIIALGYFRFDLSALPAGTIVNTATLTFTKASSNPPQTPQGVHSDNGDGLSSGRFAVYGLLDTTGNTAQDWNESTLTGDSSGEEFSFADAGFDPPLDTTTRSIDLDGVGESVSSTTASITNGALIPFLQGRLDATAERGLATFITDIENGSDGKGYAFASREAASGQPSLAIDYTVSIPLPNPDEDHDDLDDAWEAHHFGTLALTGLEDSDGDGTPEWLEEALGLNPNDPNETFRSSMVNISAGSFSLTWPNAPGLTFVVQSDTSLPGSWTTVEATINGSASPAMLSHPITPSSPIRFYRVAVTQP